MANLNGKSYCQIDVQGECRSQTCLDYANRRCGANAEGKFICIMPSRSQVCGIAQQWRKVKGERGEGRGERGHSGILDFVELFVFLR